jgi:hypothetical protein
MLKNRIISNYTVVGDNKDITQENKVHSIPKIIQKAIIEEGSKTATKIEEKLPKGQPKVELVKNDDGVVIGLNIICSCGETFSVELEFE